MNFLLAVIVVLLLLAVVTASGSGSYRYTGDPDHKPRVSEKERTL